MQMCVTLTDKKIKAPNCTIIQQHKICNSCFRFMDFQGMPVFEDSVLQEYHAVSLGNQFPTFCTNTIYRFQTSRPFKMKKL